MMEWGSFFKLIAQIAILAGMMFVFSAAISVVMDEFRKRRGRE